MIGFYIDWIYSPTGYDWKIPPKSFQWGVDMISEFMYLLWSMGAWGLILVKLMNGWVLQTCLVSRCLPNQAPIHCGCPDARRKTPTTLGCTESCLSVGPSERHSPGKSRTSRTRFYRLPDASKVNHAFWGQKQNTLAPYWKWNGNAHSREIP